MTAILAGIAGAAVIIGLIIGLIRWALQSFKETDDAADLIEKWRNGK